MSIERTFYCDAEGCERHVRTASLTGRPSANSGVIWVTDPGGHGGRTLHFCSWDCILKYAAGQEPMEIIALRDGGDDA